MARKRTAVVPRAVLGASFGGVIPACVLAGIQACGTTTNPPGVAAVAYCCFEASVHDADASDATETDAPSDGGDANDAPEGG
jgi:hypothetical protein